MGKERWGAFSFLLDKTVEEHIAETDRRRAAWQSKASEEISACMSNSLMANDLLKRRVF